MRTFTTVPGRPRRLTSAVSRRRRVTLALRPPTTTRADRAVRGSSMRNRRRCAQRLGLPELGAVVATGGAGDGWPDAPDAGAAGQADRASLKRRMSTPRV